MKNLAFIYGIPRGGTTLVWGIINEHPNSVPIRKDDTTSESGIYVHNQNPKKYIEDKILPNSNFLFFEKTPIHTLYHKQINKDFPNSKKIIIDRFPLAICNSLKKVSWTEYYNKRINSDIKLYYKNLNEIRRYENTFNLRFQDLIENFENTVSEMFKFLNLSYSAQDIVNIKKKILHKHILPNKNAFRKGKVHSWRLEMSPYDISHFRDNLSKEIEDFNNYWK